MLNIRFGLKSRDFSPILHNRITMKISIHYFLVPFFYILVAISGRMFTSTGTWYQDLMKPSFTPPGALIGVMWTLIYILTALSLIFFIHNAKNHHSLWPVIAL